MKGRYDDIIWQAHHVSEKHPQMSIKNRSAQFAPFAALSGYEQAIEKTGNEVNYNPYTYENIEEI